MAARRKTSKTSKKKAVRKKKSVRRKAGWGGRRRGAGRPLGTGTGPSKHARINRVVAMLSNDELKILQAHARREKLPLGTAAYRIIALALRRLR
ncbi:MAG TPA: hypothetical protein VGB31_07675 [Myxococcota bacterium]